MRIQRALFLSDLHLGWVPCRRSHEALLRHLPEAADGCELIVLNGDVLDVHRGAPGAAERERIAQLAEQVTTWRGEGREVIYIEGNHDPMGERLPGGVDLAPDRWQHRFEGFDGQVIQVFHGHRFDPSPWNPGRYEGYGRHALRVENALYHKSLPVRRVYPHSMGWLVGAVGRIEGVLWRPALVTRSKALREGADVVVHGHWHFGPGSDTVGEHPSWRTGSWVADGHRGSVNRILRYERGRFERITLEDGRWVAPGDGL